MAKKFKPLIYIRSKSGYFYRYYITKGKKDIKKIEIKKYDPKIKKHTLFSWKK